MYPTATPIYVVILLLLHARAQIPNFWVSNSAWSGTAWGSICFDYSQYTPSCGWQVILSSSALLTTLQTWDSTVTRFDDYSFIITNVNYNADFTTAPASCYSVTLTGNFANEPPDVVAGWYCVCTILTGSCQSVPYATAPIGLLTSTDSLSTLGPPLPFLPGSDLDSMTMTKRSYCYIGPELSTYTDARSLLECAGHCLAQSTCVGLNDWVSTTSYVCSLVRENPDTNEALKGFLSGCTFWQVVSKFNLAV